MTGRVVRRIDHVAIATDDVPRVFELLRDRLGLPEMMQPTSLPPTFGYPTTAWLNLGGMPLEVLEPPPGTPLPAGDLEIGGLVFEPEPPDAAVAELERRGVGFTPPQRYDYPEGFVRGAPEVPGLSPELEPGTPHGTQFFLPGFVGGNVFVVCYEWAFVSAEAMRAALRRQLDATSDNPLGIDAAAEIVVGATDLGSERDRWQVLLDPVAEPEPGLWDFGGGPALRVVEHGRDAIVGLKLEVADLERAERYLKEHDMLASSADGELVIEPAALDGLNLSLVSAGA